MTSDPQQGSGAHDPNRPFERDALLNKPGIVGARWWHRGLVDEERAMSRRAALRTLALGAGVVATIGACGAVIAAAAAPDHEFRRRSSLDMQRLYGWDFGADGEQLVYDGLSYQPFDPMALDRIAAELSPAHYRPLHVPTLLESVTAFPTARLPDPDPLRIFQPLRNVLRPIFTRTMDAAYRQGAALASLLSQRDPAAAVVVDLPGPEAVAFAAGAAQALEPVFLLDNWPHPRGVVRAHLALAAAAYYQPLFARAAVTRPPAARPLFVLDRTRLAAYSDETERFDNRYVARMPGPAALQPLGLTRVIYVVPTQYDVPELDDLNDAFVSLAATGFEVRALAAYALSGSEPFYYGGSQFTHGNFWADYGWEPGRAPTADVWANRGALAYRPQPRLTQFARGARPMDFGTVPVAVAIATGALLGAAFDRRGSWNRSSSSSSSWGG